MNICRVSSPSFKAVVPVVYLAKNPKNNEYVPVLKKENLRKCHGQVVRNLNRTIKKNPNSYLVNYYRQYDSDYRHIPYVHSVYQPRGPVVYMVTGKDVDVLNQLARPVGIAKGHSMDALGHSKSFEAQLAAQNYQKSVNNFINTSESKLKSTEDDSPLTLFVYFEPEYTKREHKLKGFNFVDCEFKENGLDTN